MIEDLSPEIDTSHVNIGGATYASTPQYAQILSLFLSRG
jgi:hypothetical protein